MPIQPTDVEQFITALDAGTLEPRLAQLLSNVATAVMEYQRKGEVKLTLKFQHMDNASQMIVQAELAFKAPTSRGEQTEKRNSKTMYWVHQKGHLTDLPPSTSDDMFAAPKTPKATQNEEQ